MIQSFWYTGIWFFGDLPLGTLLGEHATECLVRFDFFSAGITPGEFFEIRLSGKGLLLGLPGAPKNSSQ